MKRTAVYSAAVCCMVLLAVLFSNCGNPDKGQVPVTTTSREALKLYREGMALLEQIQTEKAKALFEEAVRKDSTFAMAHLRLAYTSFEPRDFLRHLSKAVSLADRVSEGEMLFIRQQNEFTNGNNKQGAELIRKLIGLYPRDKEAHLALAFYLNGLQRFEESAGEFQKAVAVDPSYSAGFNQMAYGYMLAGVTNQAEKAIKKYIELRPGEPNPYDSQGDILRKSGKLDESTASFRKALSIDSTFLTSHYGIGINLAMRGKIDDSMAEFDAAFKKAPNDGQRRACQYARALACATAQDNQKALDIFKKCLSMDEKNQDVTARSNDLQFIATILLEQKQFDKSREAAVRALKLIEASGVSEDLKKISREQFLQFESDMACRQGRLKLAADKAEAFRKATSYRNDPAYAWVYQNLIGSIALADKRYDDAIRELEKANPRNCYDQYELGEAYAAKGGKAKAKELFSKVANFNENNWNFAFLRVKAQKKLQSL